MYTPGLVSISFRMHSPEEIAAAASAAGLKAIEWGSDVHAPYADPGRLRQVAAITAKYNLTTCSYGTYYKIGKNAPEEVLPYIDAAKILGTNLLRLWCGTKASEQYGQQERERLFADCRILAAFAEKAGVTLAMEYHRNTFTDSITSAIDLMKAVDSTAFQMYWQPSQFRSVEENLTELKQLAPFVTVIHVFNWKQANRYPLAEAIETWKRYKALLSGDHSMLLEFMPDDLLSSLPNEAAALRQILED